MSPSVHEFIVDIVGRRLPVRKCSPDSRHSLASISGFAEGDQLAHTHTHAHAKAKHREHSMS
eukprot:1159635-Pelagomonas_calceolata.AAC.12